MRPSVIVIWGSVCVMALLSVVALLFWFAAPRWQPELVMRYSPSLRHVIEAHGYYAQASFGATMTSPNGTIVVASRRDLRKSAVDEHGFVTYSEPTILNCYARFVAIYGDDIFQQMAALDHKNDDQFTQTIINYLDDHLHKPAAKKILWQYSDAGNRSAKSRLYHQATAVPQRIDQATLERAIRR